MFQTFCAVSFSEAVKKPEDESNEVRGKGEKKNGICIYTDKSKKKSW